MSSKKQLLRNSVFLIFLIGLTFFVVFKNYDFKDTINIILNSNKGYIFLGLVVMFLSIVFESINLSLCS